MLKLSYRSICIVLFNFISIIVLYFSISHLVCIHLFFRLSISVGMKVGENSGKVWTRRWEKACEWESRRECATDRERTNVSVGMRVQGRERAREEQYATGAMQECMCKRWKHMMLAHALLCMTILGQGGACARTRKWWATWCVMWFPVQTATQLSLTKAPWLVLWGFFLSYLLFNPTWVVCIRSTLSREDFCTRCHQDTIYWSAELPGNSKGGGCPESSC